MRVRPERSKAELNSVRKGFEWKGVWGKTTKIQLKFFSRKLENNINYYIFEVDKVDRFW